jgi:hypothetical protein
MVEHISWLDAPILFSLMETPATFVIEPAAAKSWLSGSFFDSPTRAWSTPRSRSTYARSCERRGKVNYVALAKALSDSRA